MSFHETRFPTDISYASIGGPGFKTSIIEVDSGAEERVSRWASARHRYDVAYGIRSLTQLSTLKTFYMARRGAAYGFRFKDWLDFTSAANGIADPDDEDQQLGVGDGSTKTFQLIKIYTSGAVERTRTITKPVPDTTIIAIDGVAQSSGWSVNTATGLVTFTSAPAVDEVVTAGFEFDVPVRFSQTSDDWLGASIDSFETGSLPSIPLVEIIEASQISGEFYFGGAFEATYDADFSISLLNGRVQSLITTVIDRYATLPDYTNLPEGGPYFYLYNNGSQLIIVNDHTDSFVANLTAGCFLILVLGPNGWIAK